MNRYPSHVLPTVALIIGAGLAWPSQARTQATTATAPTPPPTSMRGDEAARENATTLAQMLQGRLAGVTVSPSPDGGIIVRMGGPTSFYSDQNPLFVVDGVPIEASRTTLNWLNPHDIESVDALKDPSQTAIYGVRGANGVIIIKTKGAH
ncbi:MAG TPA: TonB-dependent receptor plug domain-containing protein [Gemmatimonadales bacterium]|nr:TonB-dependent receptor plug domain-containing protein [Gemmatimonadales bacterium]